MKLHLNPSGKGSPEGRKTEAATYGMYEDTFRNAAVYSSPIIDKMRASEGRAAGYMSFAQGSRRDSELEPLGHDKSYGDIKRKSNLASLNAEYLD